MQDYPEKESNIAFITAKNTQSDAKEFYHTNILISLLKECTKEKLLNSRSIRRLHHQIFLIQIMGIIFAYIFYVLSLDYFIINSFVFSRFQLLIFIVFWLTLVFVAKLKNTRRKLKVVDSNLAKAIRTTSQYREHIASNFIVKTKLEIALKTAEDALENPRLYF